MRKFWNVWLKTGHGKMIGREANSPDQWFAFVGDLE